MSGTRWWIIHADALKAGAAGFALTTALMLTRIFL